MAQCLGEGEQGKNNKPGEERLQEFHVLK
jgi:hypothetical protein